MKQEKPFEIKEWDVIPENQEPAYVSDANAEIRRLQSELKRKSEACIHFAKANQCFIETINGLNQQLADAPTWGEWKDATRENLSKASVGLYEFETNDGMTFLASWRITISSYPWLKMDGETCRDEDFELNPRFRRLNYEPKPAREVEKTYWGKTIKELVNDYSDSYEGELARDLLTKQTELAAVQAELRELKGER